MISSSRHVFSNRKHLFVIRIASGAVSPVQPETTMQDDSDEEEFVYPGDSASSPRSLTPPLQFEEAPSPPPFSEHSIPSRNPSEHPPSTKKTPTLEQLEDLHAASASGDLKRVQSVFGRAVEVGEVDPFALANDASPRTGLTATHTAASRGFLDIVKWCMSLRISDLHLLIFLGNSGGGMRSNT